MIILGQFSYFSIKTRVLIGSTLISAFYGELEKASYPGIIISYSSLLSPLGINVILSFLLIQEGQLSVSGIKMYWLKA